MRKTTIILLCLVLVMAACGGSGDGGEDPPGTNPPSTSTPETDPTKYSNPVIARSVPDPTIIRAEDGNFYLYGTEDTRGVPIFRSPNLVNWSFIGTAFNDATRPDFLRDEAGYPTGGIWAPEINYIDGKYVLTYSMSTWGGGDKCGIGAAVADSPAGPFTVVSNPMFQSFEVGVTNSIDQTTFKDGSRYYLFWGSFRGIYGAELSDNGLTLKYAGADKVQVAGNDYEATYIYYKDGYYYLFASWGSCCEGLNSTYTTVVGRAENLFGPYLNKAGERMLDNRHEVLIRNTSRFKGVGHNSQLIQDDEGNDYILYHGHDAAQGGSTGRTVLIDRVMWADGWPYVLNGEPSVSAVKPVFND